MWVAAWEEVPSSWLKNMDHMFMRSPMYLATLS